MVMQSVMEQARKEMGGRDHTRKEYVSWRGCIHVVGGNRRRLASSRTGQQLHEDTIRNWRIGQVIKLLLTKMREELH